MAEMDITDLEASGVNGLLDVATTLHARDLPIIQLLGYTIVIS